MSSDKYNDKLSKQEPEGEPDRPRMMIVQLLFKGKPKKVTANELFSALEKQFGDLGNTPRFEPSADSEGELFMFLLPKYKAVFRDKPDGVPVIANFLVPDGELELKADELKRSQFWDIKDGEALIDGCKYGVVLFATLSAALPYAQQAEVILGLVGAALDCYDDCRALYVPDTGKLTTPEGFRECEKYSLSERFIRLFVKARFFNIRDTEGDMVVDTLGFNVFDAPDVQMHFHGLDPNHVVNYVYNIASYQFENEFPIKSGETVDSLDKNGRMQWEPQWRTQYENALIEPPRVVLDINCGKYAAGGRSDAFDGEVFDGGVQ